MRRDWTFHRLPAPAPGRPEGLPEGVRELIGDLRDRDALARWYLEPDPGTGCVLGGWSTPAVQRSLAERLDCLLPGQVDAVQTPGDVSEVALASSELALDLGHPVPDPAGLAVAHLLRLVELVPEKERSTFLFICWENWTRDLDAAERLELARRAASEGAALLAAAELEHVAWQGYLGALAATLDDGAGPANYLVYDQAHRTHARLGIPPAAEALAARVVRAAVTGPAIPVGMPVELGLRTA